MAAPRIVLLAHLDASLAKEVYELIVSRLNEVAGTDDCRRGDVMLWPGRSTVFRAMLRFYQVIETESIPRWSFTRHNPFDANSWATIGYPWGDVPEPAPDEESAR